MLNPEKFMTVLGCQSEKIASSQGSVSAEGIAKGSVLSAAVGSTAAERNSVLLRPGEPKESIPKQPIKEAASNRERL
jgi:hypothetical protein